MKHISELLNELLQRIKNGQSTTRRRIQTHRNNAGNHRYFPPAGPGTPAPADKSGSDPE